MNRRTSIAGCSFILLVLASSAARGQTPNAGDRDASGRVMAKATVTMVQPGSYGQPVSGLKLLIVTDGGDRTATTTNDAGVASSWLAPGTYRFVTPDAVSWNGKKYTWDLLVPVKAGMSVIKLTQENATGVALSPAPTANPTLQQEAGTPSLQATNSVTQVQTVSPPISPRRSGFWFNVGLGYGALTCKDCDTYINGLSGGLSLGGAVSPRFLLGVGTTGWYKSEGGVTLSAGTLDARIRFYPSSTGGFFLTGGAGVGSISADVAGLGSDSETGFGLMLGLGWDVRLGNSVSLTPFWNGFAVQASNSDASVGQVGLGITFH